MPDTANVQERRREALKKVIENYCVTTRADEPGLEEDIQRFFKDQEDVPREDCERWCAVTRHEDRVWAYPVYTNRGAAEGRAVEYVRDGIYPELPIAVVDLDTGCAYEADYSALAFVGDAPEGESSEPTVPRVVTPLDEAPDADTSLYAIAAVFIVTASKARDAWDFFESCEHSEGAHAASNPHAITREQTINPDWTIDLTYGATKLTPTPILAGEEEER